jgi:hypothetical protein
MRKSLNLVKTNDFKAGTDFYQMHVKELLLLRQSLHGLLVIVDKPVSDDPSIIHVKCKGGRSFPIHKCIVRAYEVFEPIFSKSFDTPSQIDMLEDFSEDSLISVMKFMYLGTLDDNFEQNPFSKGKRSDFVHLVYESHCAADLLNLKPLKGFSLNRLKNILSERKFGGRQYSVGEATRDADALLNCLYHPHGGSEGKDVIRGIIENEIRQDCASVWFHQFIVHRVKDIDLWDRLRDIDPNLFDCYVYLQDSIRESVLTLEKDEVIANFKLIEVKSYTIPDVKFGDFGSAEVNLPKVTEEKLVESGFKPVNVEGKRNTLSVNLPDTEDLPESAWDDADL